MLKKVLFLIICLFSFIGFINAEELAPNSKSAILIEASTGKVLYEKNADEALAPASMTKIMTLLLTMEAVEKGTIKLSDMVRVSENAASMGGSQVFLAANDEYKLEEIIKAVCIASGNDAAVVLAEAIGGSTDKFVEMMNKMAIMARELIKHEIILKYSSIYEENLNKPDGSSLWMVNTNRLVRFYNGVDGLKTGYTSNAGFCLTATGMWNNMRLISVVMGAESQDARTDDTVSLLNHGKSSYKINTILKKDDVVDELNVELGEQRRSKVVPIEDATDLLSVTDEKPRYEYITKLKNVTAPIKYGDKVGFVDIYKNGKKINTVSLTVKKNVEKVKFGTLLKRMIEVVVLGN